MLFGEPGARGRKVKRKREETSWEAVARGTHKKGRKREEGRKERGEGR